MKKYVLAVFIISLISKLQITFQKSVLLRQNNPLVVSVEDKRKNMSKAEQDKVVHKMTVELLYVRKYGSHFG
jgi:hypothetical protein